eukprot:INCI815.1.p1 GENE.INCI815.1~~INCI815.1.p1  ORF type:complete len:122 (+),score=11.60 INCI815.1:147-512(+)
MHPFCFTIPYAWLLAIGGVIGYFAKGSLVSLGAGCGSGLVVGFLGYRSLNKFHAGKPATVETVASFVISAILSYVMYTRYQSTSKFMPSGLVAVLSVCMSLFLAYRLVSPRPIKKKDDTTK